jgi:putative copper export protein
MREGEQCLVDGGDGHAAMLHRVSRIFKMAHVAAPGQWNGAVAELARGPRPESRAKTVRDHLSVGREGKHGDLLRPAAQT